MGARFLTSVGNPSFSTISNQALGWLKKLIDHTMPVRKLDKKLFLTISSNFSPTDQTKNKKTNPNNRKLLILIKYDLCME